MLSTLISIFFSLLFGFGYPFCDLYHSKLIMQILSILSVISNAISYVDTNYLSVKNY